MFVAEAAVSALFQALFQALLSENLLKLARREGVHSEVERMTKLLKTIDLYLKDAEEKQYNSGPVRTWMDELRNLAFDLEDILDVFATQGLQKKKKKLGGLTLGTLSSKSEFRSKIKGIDRRLDDIYRSMNGLGLQQIVIGESSTAPKQEWLKHESTSVVDELCIAGRDEEKKKLIELVLKSSSSEREKVHVIPVVGMGLIGKTTLAKLVYNDAMVEQHFDFRLWIYVSYQFDFQKIMETILRRVGDRTFGNDTLDEILEKLKKRIASKKLLIVLDDVWQSDTTQWDEAQNLFCKAAEQTKVMLTTRHEEVAKAWGTKPSECLYLGPLKAEDSWSIFKQYAFENRDIE